MGKIADAFEAVLAQRVSAIMAEGENVDMQIALELPEDIAKRLELAWRDVSRESAIYIYNGQKGESS